MSRLRDLADAADRHAEHRELTDTPEAESVLSDLAPDMARLLADISDEFITMRSFARGGYHPFEAHDDACDDEEPCDGCALLARLRELEERA